MRYLAAAVGIALLVMVAGGIDQPEATGAQGCLPSVPFDEVPLPGPSVQQAQPGVQAGPVPADIATIYEEAAAQYGIPAALLMGIGWEETKHGAGMAVSSAGAQGFMQFMPATWAVYGQGGDPTNPVDAIPAAARLLVANGASEGGDGILRAVFAYNHATWYVNDVLTWAHQYSGAASTAGCTGEAPTVGGASEQELLNSTGVALNPQQQADVRAGGLDPRLIALLIWIGERHSIVVTALRADHKPGTNHAAGRAVDIGAVDGVVCQNQTPADACGALAVELANLSGPLKPNELIACFDPDNNPATDNNGVGNATIWAQADHCDHDHVGWDG